MESMPVKQVIDGRLYDTQKATCVASCDNGLSAGDSSHLSELLHVTSKGVFFIAGEGGPSTRWCVQVGYSTSGSEGIIALSEREALRWCEVSKIDADTIVKNFPSIVEA
jgi:hypothetical protein